jgi:hypothetical protein
MQTQSTTTAGTHTQKSGCPPVVPLQASSGDQENRRRRKDDQEHRLLVAGLIKVKICGI